jgi:hypothetical protein
MASRTEESRPVKAITLGAYLRTSNRPRSQGPVVVSHGQPLTRAEIAVLPSPP